MYYDRHIEIYGGEKALKYFQTAATLLIFQIPKRFSENGWICISAPSSTMGLDLEGKALLLRS